MSVKKNLWTRREAAEYIGVHYQTLANWASTGRYRLKYTKIGGRVYYRQSDVEAWIKSGERTQVEV